MVAHWEGGLDGTLGRSKVARMPSPIVLTSVPCCRPMMSAVSFRSVQRPSPGVVACLARRTGRVDDVGEQHRHQLSLARRSGNAEFFADEALDVVKCRVSASPVHE